MARLWISLLLIVGLVYSTAAKNVFSNYSFYCEYYIVSSYSPLNYCGELQTLGALQFFREHSIQACVIYLRFRRMYTDSVTRSFIAKQVLSIVNTKPVLLLDDLAVKYLYPKLKDAAVSGVNGNPPPMCRGVLEVYDFSKIKTWFEKRGYYLNKVLVLYDKNTITSSFLVSDLEESFPKNVPFDSLPVVSVQDLEEIKTSPYSLIIDLILSLKDKEGRLLSFEESSAYVREIFKDSFLVGINPIQMKLGFDFIMSADFFEMGYRAAKILYLGSKYCTKSRMVILVNPKLRGRFDVKED